MRRLLAMVVAATGGLTMLIAVGCLAVAGAIAGEGAMPRPGRKK